MKVLMVSGDPNVLKQGTGAHERFLLQKSVVDRLEVVIIVRGQLWLVFKKFLRLRGQPFDVVTAQDPFWRGHLAGHLAWLLGAKLNLQVHTDLSALPWLKHRWAIFNLRKADSIRVVSEKIKQQVEHAGVKARVHILPIYIDVERFRHIAHMPQKNKKTILWIGRFEEEKDPLRTLAIFKAVRESGIDARLIMLGSGSLEARLKAAAMPLAPPVEFPGWQDPVAYLVRADVVVCTSKHESYGASIVEALAAGVPVVAPDVGIAREAGAIVVPREQLAEAVIDVLKKGTRGTLRLKLPSASEWARRWKETL